MEGERDVLPLVDSGPLRLPSLCLSSQGAGEDCPRQGRGFLDSPLLASEALVPSSVEPVGRNPKSPSSSAGPSGSTSLVPGTQECQNPSSFSLASFRRQGEEAGLSQRAAQFAAESLRESSRNTYDSRLVHFRKWCQDHACDPSTASLGQVADFLVYLFDKGLTVAIF